MTNDIIEIAKSAGFKVHPSGLVTVGSNADWDKLGPMLTKFAELIQARAWISVEDKLPEEFVEVLAVRHGLIGIGRTWIHVSGERWWEFKGTSGMGVHAQSFTHWMALPKRPTAHIVDAADMIAAAQKGSV